MPDIFAPDSRPLVDPKPNMPQDVTLQSNTGQNDNGSVYGSGLLSTVERWGGVAADLYSSFSGNGKKDTKPTPVQGPAPAPAAAPGWKSYLPWIVGAAVVVVIIFFARRK